MFSYYFFHCFFLFLTEEGNLLISFIFCFLIYFNFLIFFCTFHYFVSFIFVSFWVCLFDFFFSFFCISISHSFSFHFIIFFFSLCFCYSYSSFIYYGLLLLLLLLLKKQICAQLLLQENMVIYKLEAHSHTIQIHQGYLLFFKTKHF